MGYATVISGGEDGRYVIEIDSGENDRVALLAAATAALASLEAKIIAQQVVIDDADAAEAAMAAELSDLFDQIVATMEETPGITPAAQPLFEKLTLEYHHLQAQSAPARTAMRSLKLAKVAAQKKVTQWTDLPTIERKPAWCADLTQDATGFVATIEIKGESDLVLIAPGAPTPSVASNGFLLNRELMSPAQAFYNAALLPGWQKYLPTFRWGTITAQDDETETVDIDLADALSSAQRLDVNQASTLSGVPVEYMECGYSIFEVGDRVVVKFEGQDWTQPKVIGFLDNPRACAWSCIGGPRATQLDHIYFESPGPDVMTAMLAGTPQCKFDGGAWVTMERDTATQTNAETSPYYNGAQYWEAFVAGPDDHALLTLFPNGANQTNAETTVACIGVTLLPKLPFPKPPGHVRRICEFRIVSGGYLFNVATHDVGWATEYTTWSARTKGGIKYYAPLFSQNILALNYTLTGDAP